MKWGRNPTLEISLNYQTFSLSECGHYSVKAEANHPNPQRTRPRSHECGVQATIPFANVDQLCEREGGTNTKTQ